MDDAELVRQVLLGYGSAFKDLIERYTGKILAICRARLLRHDVVDDLVQETFLRALDRLPTLHDPSRFGHWVCSIARNLCSDWINDRHRDHVSLDVVMPDHLVSPRETPPDHRDHALNIRNCVRRLTVDLREVIELYYSGGRMTYGQIGELLGVSPAKVNQMLTRARRLLKSCLEREISNGGRNCGGGEP